MAHAVHIGLLLWLLAMATASCASAGKSSAATPPLEKLLNSGTGLAICWLGNDSWVLRGQGQLIAFDLDLSLKPERLAPPAISVQELAPKLDVVFVTHSHGDHFDHKTAKVLAKESKCLFVIPANCVQQAKEAGIPAERIVIARPKEELEVRGIHVQALHAVHGHRFQAVQRAANMEDCGYVLTFAGLRILQPGDSILMENHLKIREIDVMFVSPTDHNMAIEPAVRLITTVKPRMVIPQHFGTYKTTPENDFWTVGRPKELRAALPGEFRKRYRQLEQGEVFEINMTNDE